MFYGAKAEPDLTLFERIHIFLAVHWRGVITLITPIIMLAVVLPLPARPHLWVGYTLLNMVVYWVSECIPLPVTSFLPVMIFPLTGVASTAAVTRAYMSDTIIMFLGSLFLAYSIEQSNLHKRLAYFTIRTIGYSHTRLLMAICVVTTFISMWITNTAATTMMVPINFAILRVFESQGLLKLYETDEHGDQYASPITVCYFCAATYSATIGGIGTLIGTGTNLAFKGLFESEYPTAPEYLSFPRFAAFGVVLMLLLETWCYLCMSVQYLGLFRSNSKAAQRAHITDQGIAAAERTILEGTKQLGSFSFWEAMVFLLFLGAILSFFCLSPQIFVGWADAIKNLFDIPGKTKFIRDSALATLVTCLMVLLPRNLDFFNNFSAKYPEELPKGKIGSVLDWQLLNKSMPWSFMFLLGGGFALSEGAKTSGLNDRIGKSLQFLQNVSNPGIIFIIAFIVMIVTNFASNVAVANVMVPIAMQVAKNVKVNPLWYCNVAGFTASFCFMMAVGTPGNLIVQGAAHIPTFRMIQAGVGVSAGTLLITWFLMYVYAPIVWPEVKELPDWAK